MELLLLRLFPLVAAGAVAWAVARAVTGWSCSLAPRLGAVDAPGERSSHLEPTPRLGGIGLVAAFLLSALGLIVLYGPIQDFIGFDSHDPVATLPLLGLALAAIGGFLIGFADDLGRLPVAGKFLGQALLAAAIPALGLRPEQLALPWLGTIELPLAVGWILASVWIVVMMNAINFMDGANGVAGRIATVGGAGIAALAIDRSWCYDVALLGVALWGAATGFLRWNLGQARTFLGDCGSQALGAILATLALYVAVNDLAPLDPDLVPARRDPFLALLILFAIPLHDTGYTLLRRTMRGENVLRPHREHLYQRYLDAVGGDHDRTSGFVWFYSLLCAVLAVLYVRFSNAGDDVFRTLLLLGAVAVAWTYHGKVVAAERQPLAPPAPLPTAQPDRTAPPPPPPPSLDRRAAWDAATYALTALLRERGVSAATILVAPEGGVSRVEKPEEAYLRIDAPEQLAPLEQWGERYVEKSDSLPGVPSLRVVGLDANRVLYLTLASAPSAPGKSFLLAEEPHVAHPLMAFDGRELAAGRRVPFRPGAGDAALPAS